MPSDSSRCRVLYLNPTADLYGASRGLLNILRNLDRTRFDPTVIVPGAGPLQACLSEIGIRCFVVPSLTVLRKGMIQPFGLMALAGSLLPGVRGVARLAADADVIHTNSSVVLSGAIAARWTGRPHVWHIREITGSWWLARLALHLSSRVVCVSNATAAQFESLPRRERVCVIYDGVEPLRIARNLRRRDAQASFGLAEDAIVVGALGYLNPRKGVDMLIEAFAHLRRRYRGALRLLIAGEPFPGNESHVKQLRARVDALGLSDEIIFAGFVADVARFFAALDIFAFAAREPEGFGLAVVEASAAGVPVVATCLGGILEIIDDGVTGLLVPPNSVEHFTNALRGLLEDPVKRQAMGLQGAQQMAARFNLQRQVAELQAIYAELS